MAKLSQLDRAIANVKARRDLLDAVLLELDAQKPPAKKPTTGRKVRKLGSVLDEPAS